MPLRYLGVEEFNLDATHFGLLIESLTDRVLRETRDQPLTYQNLNIVHQIVTAEVTGWLGTNEQSLFVTVFLVTKLTVDDVLRGLMAHQSWASGQTINEPAFHLLTAQAIGLLCGEVWLKLICEGHYTEEGPDNLGATVLALAHRRATEKPKGD